MYERQVKYPLNASGRKPNAKIRPTEMKKGKPMTPESINLWFNISNMLLVFGAIIIALGTCGAIGTAYLKELETDRRIAEAHAEAARANERAAELEAQTAQLKRDTAFAITAAVAL